MKLGVFGLHAKIPRNQILVSWLNPENPLRGAFTLGSHSIDHKGARKLSIWKGYNDHMDISSWDQNNFGFIFKNFANIFNFVYVSSDDETYFTFNTIRKYDLSRLTIFSSGNIDEYTPFNGNISSVSHSLCDKSIAGDSIPNICLDLGQAKCKMETHLC